MPTNIEDHRKRKAIDAQLAKLQAKRDIQLAALDDARALLAKHYATEERLLIAAYNRISYTERHGIAPEDDPAD